MSLRGQQCIGTTKPQGRVSGLHLPYFIDIKTCEILQAGMIDSAHICTFDELRGSNLQHGLFFVCNKIDI